MEKSEALMLTESAIMKQSPSTVQYLDTGWNYHLAKGCVKG